MIIERNIETRPYHCVMFLMDETTEHPVHLEAGDFVAFDYKKNEIAFSRNGIELYMTGGTVPLAGAPHIGRVIGLGRGLIVANFTAARHFVYIIASLFGLTVGAVEETEGGCKFQFTAE